MKKLIAMFACFLTITAARVAPDEPPAVHNDEIEQTQAETILSAAENRANMDVPANIRPCVLTVIGLAIAGVGIGTGVTIERTTKTVNVKNNITLDCYSPIEVQPHEPPHPYPRDVIEYGDFFAFPYNEQGTNLLFIPEEFCLENTHDDVLREFLLCRFKDQCPLVDLIEIFMPTHEAVEKGLVVLSEGCDTAAPEVFLKLGAIADYLRESVD